MTGLMGALGLNNVSADPNDIPDGKYDGVIYESQYVLHKKNGEVRVSHVTTFKVTDGDYNGAQRQKWDTIGVNPLNAQGQPAEKVEEIASFTPAQSEQQKQWYKKFLQDMGIHDFDNAKPEDLVGKEVTFGVKTNNGFKNVNFQELRSPSTPAPVAVGGFDAGGTFSPLTDEPPF